MNSFEIFAAVATLFGVIFASLRSKYTWYMSMIAIMCCAIFYLQSNLYAQVLLQFVYMAQTIYGLIKWSNSKEIEITSMNGTEIFKSFTQMIALSLLLYLVFRTTNDANPLMDSLITGVSLIANFLLIKKKIENWLVWICSNLMCVSLFIEQKMDLFALLYTIIAIISLTSYFKWKRIVNSRLKAEKILENIL